MRILAFFAAFCLSLPAYATTARFLPLPELVKTADATIQAHAVHQHSFWQGPRILTLITLQVDDVWVGQTPRQLDVLTAGGVVGPIGQRVDGAAQIVPGQSVVAHLRREVTGEYVPVAMAQGVWIVRQDVPGALTVGRSNLDRLVGAPAGYTMPTTLAALKQAVLEAAHAP